MREELRAALRTVLAFSLGIVIGALARPEPSAVLPYAYLFLTSWWARPASTWASPGGSCWGPGGG